MRATRQVLAMALVTTLIAVHLPSTCYAQPSAAIFTENVSGTASTPYAYRGSGPSGAEPLVSAGCSVVAPTGCGQGSAQTWALGPGIGVSTLLSGDSATAGASATIYWGFEVVDNGDSAPDAIYVPVDIIGYLGTGTTGANGVDPVTGSQTGINNTATASIAYGTKTLTLTSSSATGNVPENATLVDVFNVGANVPSYISESAGCGSQIIWYGGPSINGTCTAGIDPTVSIDPTFLAENPGLSLQLIYSAGITPAVVPLPGAGLLFSWGLGALAVMAIRRRTAAMRSAAA